jgi:hypothetical protein
LAELWLGSTARQELAVTADAQAGLPYHHRDPFDRLLAAQALFENMPLVSSNEVFDQYGHSVGVAGQVLDRSGRSVRVLRARAIPHAPQANHPVDLSQGRKPLLEVSRRLDGAPLAGNSRGVWREKVWALQGATRGRDRFSVL